MFSSRVMLFHALAGAAVLAFYWRTLLTRKGSHRHKRYGRVYLVLLAPLLASVVPITIAATRDEGPARILQLVYLSLVIVTAGWTAWRAVRDRRDPVRFRGPVFLSLATMLFCAGLALLVVGIVDDNVLTVGFSVIGVVYGGAMLGFLGRPAAPDWWLNWHLNGVALLFAATHASFVGLVFRNALPELEGETMHALTQLGTIALAFGLRQWLGWRYSGRAAPDASAPARAPLADGKQALT